MLLQILLILALSILGKDMTTYGKEEEELDSDVDKSGEPSELPKETVMPSGYVCTHPNPMWCKALEKRWLQETHAKVRDQYSKFVFDLFDSGAYDNRTRPGFKDGIPDHVKIRLYVESLGPASASEMSLFQDLYLTQMWRDSRLDGVKKANLTSNVTIPMYPDIVYSLWTPDTYFRNGIFTEIIRTHDNRIGLIVKINTEGEIMVTKRLRVKASCPMHLQYFPFDRQLCELEIGSFSFDNDDIIFKWAQDPIAFKEGLSIPQFNFLTYNPVVRQFKIPTMPNEQTILVVQYLLHRKVGLYMGQIFIPSMLIVIVSWITFYINPGAVPARASVGITCVLTMMTLTTSCIGSLPTNLMYTPVDLYLGGCLLFVFGALFEFAFVNFCETTNKRRQEQEELEKVQLMEAQNNQQGPEEVQPNGGDLETGFIAQNGKVPIYERNGFKNSMVTVKKRSDCWFAVADPFLIDYCSRVIYPLMFLVFNVLYWSLSLILSNNFNEKIADDVEMRALA